MYAQQAAVGTTTARRASQGLFEKADRETHMLKKEQNDLLTQTGPGTPAGRLFRSYWLPALLASELPAKDCPP